MNTTTTDAARAYVETHPHLVAYWDQYGRPVGYTSHVTEADAENSAAAHLGEMRGNGAMIARASFYNLDPETTTYNATGAEMEH